MTDAHYESLNYTEFCERLMNAAPDMVSALKAIVWAWDNNQLTHNDIDHCRDVIVKAIGEQS